MQRTYNLNKNVTKLRMHAKASSRQIGDFLIWFLRLNKQQYFAELITTIVGFPNSVLHAGSWEVEFQKLFLCVLKFCTRKKFVML